MTIEKLLTWVTPLMFGALVGAYWILHGLYYTTNGTPDQKRDYGLEIVLGIPMLVGCLLTHLLIRRLANQNALYVWLIEGVMVAAAVAVFFRS